MTEERAKRILSVEVNTYDYKDNVVDENQYDRTGVIAEKVVEIMPEVVSYREIQQDEIDALKAENASLAERLAKIQEKLDDITRNTR